MRILALAMIGVALLALPAGALAAPLSFVASDPQQWVITPVPTPTVDVISQTVTLGQAQADIYEEVRFTNQLLLLFLPVMAGALIFAWLRVRVR